MLEELLCEIYARLQYEQTRIEMDIQKGTHNQFDTWEGSLIEKYDFGEEENLIHDAGRTNPMVQDELEVVHALKLNKGGISVEVVDFHTFHENKNMIW